MAIQPFNDYIYRVPTARPLSAEEHDYNLSKTEQDIATLMVLSSLLGKQVSCIPTSGLSYLVSANRYPISGINYSAEPITVTLVDSNTIPAGEFRRDLILGTTLGTVIKRTGTSGVSAAAPDYDPATEFLIKDILVASGATVGVDPTTGLEIVNESIYLNSAVNGWSFATASAKITESNDKIEAVNTDATDKFTFVKNTIVNTAGVSNLIFDCEVEAAFQYFFINVYGVGNDLIGSVNFSNGVYGLDVSNQNSQTIIIPIGDFNLSAAELVKFEIWTNTPNGNWKIDNARLGIGSAILLNEKTLLSQFINDPGFITNAELQEAISNLGGGDTSTGGTGGVDPATSADAWSLTGGLQIRAFAYNYKLELNPTNLTALPQTKDLALVAPTVDTIYSVVADALGVIVVLPGVLQAAVDPAQYFFIREFLVKAGTTEPLDPTTETGVTLEDVIYNQSGTYVGGEYAITVENTDATDDIEINDEDEPISGSTRSVKFRNYRHPGRLSCVPDADRVYGNNTHLQCTIQLDELLSTEFNHYIFLFSFWNNGVQVPNSAIGIRHNQNGFSLTNLNPQPLNIPLSVSDSNKDLVFDEIQFKVWTTGVRRINFRIDNIKLITRYPTAQTPGGIIELPEGVVCISNLCASLKATFTITNEIINWKAGVSGIKEFTGTPVVNWTEINAPTSDESKTITIDMTGAITSMGFPANYRKATNTSEDYDGTKVNKYVFDYVGSFVYYSNTLFNL